MGRQPLQAIKVRLSADLWEVKVFVLSVPTVGNDPSGQTTHVCGSTCELRCQVLMMTDGGAANMVGGRNTQLGAYIHRSIQQWQRLLLQCHRIDQCV